MKKDKLTLLCGLILLAAGCGGSSGGGTDDDDTDDGAFDAVTIDSTETTGELNIGGTLDVDEDGNLVMRLNAIPNPDDTESPYTSDDLTFTETIESAEDAELTKGVVKFQTNFSCTTQSGSETSPADIVFVVDNTGSMGATIEGVKDSIVEFALAVDDTLDAQFAMVTFGDETNDSDAFRPTQDLTDASTLESFIESSVTATGGNDFPENSLGALDCARLGGDCNLSFRDGASRIFILITDATAHTTENDVEVCDGGFGPDTVTPSPPPAVADLVTDMGGDAVFVIHNFESGGDLSANDGCADPGDLAINGGIELTLATDGDLNLISDVPLTDFLTSGYVMVCDDPGVCDNVQITCTAEDAEGRTGTVIWNGTLTCRVD